MTCAVSQEKRSRENVISDATEALSHHLDRIPSRREVRQFLQENPHLKVRQLVWRTNGKGPVERYQYPIPQ